MSLGKGGLRKPSQVLEMAGAFDKNPQRRRFDPKPTRPLSPTPPTDLPQECVRIWHELIDEFPNVSITHSDRKGLRMLAIALAAVDKAYENEEWNRFFKMEAIARSWLIHFGMTPLSRTKFATKEKPGDGENPFSKI